LLGTLYQPLITPTLAIPNIPGADKTLPLDGVRSGSGVILVAAH